METLDNPLHNPESSFINTAVRFGMIGGGAAIVHTLIGFLTEVAIQPSMMTGTLSMILIITIYVWPGREAVLSYRENNLGGFISFGQAFLVALLTLIIIVFIHHSFNHLYYNFIDPGIVDQIVESTADMMSDFGMPDEQVEQTMDQTRDTMTSLSGWALGVGTWAIGSSIIALIIAAVLKKERTELF